MARFKAEWTLGNGRGLVEVYPFKTEKGNVETFLKVEVRLREEGGMFQDGKTPARGEVAGLSGALDPANADRMAAAIQQGALLASLWEAKNGVITEESIMVFFDRLTEAEKKSYRDEKDAEQEANRKRREIADRRAFEAREKASKKAAEEYAAGAARAKKVLSEMGFVETSEGSFEQPRKAALSIPLWVRFQAAEERVEVKELRSSSFYRNRSIYFKVEGFAEKLAKKFGLTEPAGGF